MKASIKLLNAYFWKGFFGPFFTFIFPILLLFIIINTSTSSHFLPIENITAVRYITYGVMITTVMSVGFQNLPMTIIEFKKSTLIKRISAAHISKAQFMATIFIYQASWSLFVVLWTILWGGIIGNSIHGVSFTDPMTLNLLKSAPFIILAFLVSISMGLVIVALGNSVQAVAGMANLIFLPTSFLSGAFTTKESIDRSATLSNITWILPTKYSVDPFFKVAFEGYGGYTGMGWEAIAFPFIAVGLIGVFFTIAVKKFNWGE